MDGKILLRNTKSLRFLHRMIENKLATWPADYDDFSNVKAEHDYLISSGYVIVSKAYKSPKGRIRDVEITLKGMWKVWIETRPREVGCMDRDKRKILLY